MRTVTFPTQSFNPVVYKAGMESTQVEGTSRGEEPQSAMVGATPQESPEENASDHVREQVKVEVELHKEHREVGDQEENVDGGQVDRPSSSGHQSPEQMEQETEEGRVSPQSPPNGRLLEPVPCPSYAQEVYTMDRPPLYDLYAMTVSAHTCTQCHCTHVICHRCVCVCVRACVRACVCVCVCVCASVRAWVLKITVEPLVQWLLVCMCQRREKGGEGGMRERRRGRFVCTGVLNCVVMVSSAWPIRLTMVCWEEDIMLHLQRTQMGSGTTTMTALAG